MTASLTCARCRRPLLRASAIVAGMPLGRVCAAALGAALRMPLEAAADRAERAAEASFNARQLSLIDATQ